MDNIEIFRNKMSNLMDNDINSSKRTIVNDVGGGVYKKENNLDKLNDYLFDQLDKLANSKDEALKQEINKSFAITSLASQIVNNLNTRLKAIKISKDYKIDNPLFPIKENKK